MSIRDLLPFLAPVHGNRSSLTCKTKCGDACFHEVPNTSANEYFGDVVAASVSRRGLLKAGAVVGLAGAFGAVITSQDGTPALAAPKQAFDFEAIAPQTTDSSSSPRAGSRTSSCAGATSSSRRRPTSTRTTRRAPRRSSSSATTATSSASSRSTAAPNS